MNNNDLALGAVPVRLDQRESDLATQAQAVREQVVTNACILYRPERRGGRWGIVALDGVNERDTLTRPTPTHRTKRRPNP